jgi:hypothetical protein
MLVTRVFNRGLVVYINQLSAGDDDLVWEGDRDYGSRLMANVPALIDSVAADCNLNGVPDDCDLANGVGGDVIPPFGDGILDACQFDCNGNTLPDRDDIARRRVTDCNQNFVPDVCELADGSKHDCNGDGVIDDCETALFVLIGGDVDPGVVAGLHEAGHDVRIVSATRLPQQSVALFDVVVVGTNEQLEPAFCSDQLDDFVAAGGGLVLFQGKPGAAGVLCDASPVVDAGSFTIRVGTEIIDPDHPVIGGLGARDTLGGMSVWAELRDDAWLAAEWVEDGSPMAATRSYGAGRVVYFNFSTALLQNWPGDYAYGTALMLNALQFVAGDRVDCNRNGVPDECDVASGASADALPPGGDGVPDECQADCNANSIADQTDIAEGGSSDCNGNGVPDECDTDCNQNGTPDGCDIAAGEAEDCNRNHVPDACDVAQRLSVDCQENGVPDECDVAAWTSTDFNGNGVPDECDQCTNEGACDDNNVCTWDYCEGGICRHDDRVYGDVNADGAVNLADVFCVLNALAGQCGEGMQCSCINADLTPCPGGNGRSDLLDIFAILDTIGGTTICDCGEEPGAR